MRKFIREERNRCHEKEGERVKDMKTVKEIRKKTQSDEAEEEKIEEANRERYERRKECRTEREREGKVGNWEIYRTERREM